MFLPPQFRPLLIGLWLYMSWKLLSTGTLAVVGGMLLATLRGMPLEGFAAMACGAFLLYVGSLALARLGAVMASGNGPTSL